MQVFYRKNGQLVGKKRGKKGEKRKKKKKKRNAREITLPRSILRRFDMYFTLSTSVACLSLSLCIPFLSCLCPCPSLSISLCLAPTFPFQSSSFYRTVLRWKGRWLWIDQRVQKNACNNSHLNTNHEEPAQVNPGRVELKDRFTSLARGLRPFCKFFFSRIKRPRQVFCSFVIPLA